MADKIKAIKIKQKNGTYSEEVPISVNVQNVQWDENNHTLLDALGSVDISSSGKGNLQHQIDELDGDKISTNEFNSRLNDFLKDQISADTTDWLDDNVNPVGSAVIVDKTLTIEGAAADAKAVGDDLTAVKADLGDKVDLPSNGYGTSGKVLRSTGTGTEWTTVGQPTDAQTAEAVTDWLNEHPEATTSVQDDSITESKLHLNSVTTPKIQDGAVTDNKTADEYKNLFYEEVTVSTGRMSNTDYYLVTVPKYDSDNVLIPLSLSYNANQNPLEQAWDRCTTVTINGYGMLNANGTYRNGIGICDGVITTNFSFENIANDCPLYLGVKADRTILEYKMNSAITPQEMLADGCVNVFNCYFKLVENGQVVAGLAEGELYIGDTLVTEETRNPLMLMGLKPDGTIMFMACDGRTAINDGLTYLEAGELLISQGCNTVYNLDGGGSACLVVRGSKLNRNIDSNGTVVRQIRYALNVIKPSANTPTKKVYKKIGEEKQKLIEQIVPYINYINGYSLAKIGKTITDNTDLNTLLDEGKYQCANKSVANTLVNSPVNIGFSLYCLHQGGSTAITQLLISNPSGTGKQRVYYRCLNPSNNTVQYEWSQFSPDTINFDLTADSNISAGRKTCTLNGKTVCISITFTVGNEIASEGVLFTLPSTLKPTSYIEFIALKREDLTTKLLQIKPNGTICVGAYGSLTQGSYKANVTWNIA